MLKAISQKNLVKRFKSLGFTGPYSGGRHMFMQRGSLSVHIPNVHHSDISKSLLAEILRQARVSKDEWNGKG